MSKFRSSTGDEASVQGDRRVGSGGSAGRRRSAIAAVSAAALALGSAASARELSWSSIDVSARIRADGSVAIAETQSMVMSGAWNGGERRFRVEPGQSVRVDRIVRIDPASGAEKVLTKGDLDRVDHWNWTDRSTVRWRSRSPSAPEFDRTPLVYRLEIVYERIFEADSGRRYELAHDFSFADRAGPIERFSLELAAAPEWSALGSLEVDGVAREIALPARFEAGPLPPGRGFVVRGVFAWSGEGAPGLAASSRISRGLLRAIEAILAAAALLFGVQWWRRDARLGRFEPLLEFARIDEAWLDERIFSLRPEVVGAAWDRSIGSAEVAAILARLVAEGKIASRVERSGWGPFRRDVLELELLVSRDEFDVAERALISGLFPSGNRTDTDSLRKYYRSTGFDPVSKIRSRLETRVRDLAGFRDGSPRPLRKPTVLLLLGGAALVVASAILRPGGGLGFAGLGGVLALSVPALVVSGVQRSSLGVPRTALTLIAVAAAGSIAVVETLGRLLPLPGVAYLGVAGWALGLLRGAFQILSTPESEVSMARRRELAAARRWLRAELAGPTPRLDDRWFPWLVALGLAAECDRWAKRFAVAGVSAGRTIDRGGWSGSSSSVGGGSSWSGGGGSFGGAGATASFAAAVSTMAAGVPSPSSGGSSGGGGGGGGSSSGGGGGGGW